MKATPYIKALICILLASNTVLSVNAQDNEQLTRFKAVFVYNFITYIHCPESEQPAVLKIGILGNSSLEEPLREIAKKKSTRKRKLLVDVGENIEDLEQCQVLFIPSEQVGKLKEIQQRLGNQNVLTVTDTPGLADQGVAINFVLIDGRLKFEINQKALQHAGLHASAQLLKLAILVNGAGEAIR